MMHSEKNARSGNNFLTVIAKPGKVMDRSARGLIFAIL